MRLRGGKRGFPNTCVKRPHSASKWVRAARPADRLCGRLEGRTARSAASPTAPMATHAHRRMLRILSQPHLTVSPATGAIDPERRWRGDRSRFGSSVIQVFRVLRWLTLKSWGSKIRTCIGSAAREESSESLAARCGLKATRAGGDQITRRKNETGADRRIAACRVLHIVAPAVLTSGANTEGPPCEACKANMPTLPEIFPGAQSVPGPLAHRTCHFQTGSRNSSLGLVRASWANQSISGGIL
jgi:hypothetical protein